jgi:hypothetical protein
MFYILNKFKPITLNNKIFKTYFLLKIKELMDVRAQKDLKQAYLSLFALLY